MSLREELRQVTHLALTLELLFLLEGQGAGEHCACVVEAVLDHMLVLVCEPGEGAGISGEGLDDLKFSPHFSFLPSSRKPSEIHQQSNLLLYWGCSLQGQLGPDSSADGALPEGKVLLLLRPKCVFLLLSLEARAMYVPPPVTLIYPD